MWTCQEGAKFCWGSEEGGGAGPQGKLLKEESRDLGLLGWEGVESRDEGKGKVPE